MTKGLGLGSGDASGMMGKRRPKLLSPCLAHSSFRPMSQLIFFLAHSAACPVANPELPVSRSQVHWSRLDLASSTARIPAGNAWELELSAVMCICSCLPHQLEIEILFPASECALCSTAAHIGDLPALPQLVGSSWRFRGLEEAGTGHPGSSRAILGWNASD